MNDETLGFTTYEKSMDDEFETSINDVIFEMWLSQTQYTIIVSITFRFYECQ